MYVVYCDTRLLNRKCKKGTESCPTFFIQDLFKHKLVCTRSPFKLVYMINKIEKMKIAKDIT